MTLTQTVGRQRASAKEGLLLIAAVVAILYAASALLGALAKLGVPYLITSILFWLCGGSLGAWVYYRYAVSYVYTLDGVKLTLERVFSRKPRWMAQVLLREIVYVGEPDGAKKKYPGAPVTRAVCAVGADPRVAVVYKRAGSARMLLMQPNKEMEAALRAAVNSK